MPLIAACSKPAEPRREPARSAARRELASAAQPPSAAQETPSTAQATELPQLQRDRLEYTFRAAELVQRDWPDMRVSRTCVMLIEPDRQWVVNCATVPPGFTPTDLRMRSLPVHSHTGSTFESAGESISTAALLAATPAAAQVPSRAEPNNPNSALPGDNPWLVLGSLEALTLFHPAFAHATTEAWVSVAIHEFVHTHQLRAPGAERFRDAVVSGRRNSQALTHLFLSNAAFQRRVQAEYALLSRAARDDPQDRAAARRALRRWLARYLERSAFMRALAQGSQLVADDQLFSYLEGVARFVESEFLAEPSYHPQPPLSGDPRFQSYSMFLDRGYAGSPNRQLDEHYFYAIGYHVCILIDRLEPGWRSHIHAQAQWLHSLARQVAEEPK